MAHQESCSMFFFPDSTFPAKKIPPDFIAYDERELGHIHLKYILAEKVYLNLYLKCAPVSSLKYQALHQQASICLLLFCSWWTQEEKLCWFVRSTLTDQSIRQTWLLLWISVAPHPQQAHGEVLEEMWHCYWGVGRKKLAILCQVNLYLFRTTGPVCTQSQNLVKQGIPMAGNCCL